MPTDVRFFEAECEATVAYAAEGSGQPLVLLPPWAIHLVAEEALSGHGPFVATLAGGHTVVRYDRSGTGLSSRDRDDFSLSADLDVLTGLVEHLKLRRLCLVGPSHGAPLAVVFAHRYPRLVSHLVLYGSRATALTSGNTWAALRQLVFANWPVAARSISAVATRGSDPRDVDAFAELLTVSATPQTLVALQDAAIHDEHDHPPGPAPRAHAGTSSTERRASCPPTTQSSWPHGSPDADWNWWTDQLMCTRRGTLACSPSDPRLHRRRVPERAVAILSSVATAGSPGGSVLVVETVLPGGAEPHYAKTLDVLMLAITGGRERTAEQYQALFDAAGLDLTAVTLTATAFSVLEATIR